MIQNKSSRRSMLQMLLGSAVLLVSPIDLLGQATKPITRDGLEKALKLGGLKPTELIGLIEKRGVDFLLDGPTETQLRKLGATTGIIDAVAGNYRGVDAHIVRPPQPVPVAPVPPPVPRPVVRSGGSYPSAPGVYVKDSGAWSALRQESTAWHNEGFMRNLKKASGGLINAEATGQVPGSHSPIAVRSPAIFLVRPEAGLTVEDYLCVHMHGKHDDREFKISPNQLQSNDQVEIHASSLGGGLYLVEFAQGEGDYGFISKRVIPSPDNSTKTGFVYTFRILP